MNLEEAIDLIRSTTDELEYLKARTIIYNFDIECMRRSLELLPRDAFLLDVGSIVHHLLYCHQDSLFFPQKEYWEDLEKYVVDFKNKMKES
ncbi:hypothetical protein [Methanobrevibacter sp.]|uniref:hypothetical protein n=1 Tax=Methanobrevibacter sp. TaxID=66852 RepID=UPI00386632FA